MYCTAGVGTTWKEEWREGGCMVGGEGLTKENHKGDRQTDRMKGIDK